MEIHKPKPAHSWREFAVELGTIVLGILIALGLEQGVEHLRWERAVEAGRGSLHREMAFDSAYLQDRVTIAPCVDRRLAQVSAAVEQAARTGEAPAAPLNLQPPVRLLVSNEWQAERASQTLTHFPRGELSSLGLWYDQLVTLSEWREQERAAWTRLAVLNNGPKRLGPVDVALMRQEVEMARTLEYLTVLNARRQLDLARVLGVAPGPAREDFVQLSCKP